MAYTRAWNEATPVAATTNANLIAELFRFFKVDLRERLNDSLVTDWTTDPIVAKPGITGLVTGKKLFIHHSAFKTSDEVTFYNAFANEALQLDSFGSIQTPAFVIPILLPPNTTITLVRLLCKVPTGTLTGKLCSVAWNTAPVATVESSFTVTASGSFQFGTTGTISKLLAEKPYYFTIGLGDINNILVGLEITYNTPDCRYTI